MSLKGASPLVSVYKKEMKIMFEILLLTSSFIAGIVFTAAITKILTVAKRRKIKKEIDKNLSFKIY